MQSVQEKYKNLQEYLKSLGSVAVAFSSGVDSRKSMLFPLESSQISHAYVRSILWSGDLQPSFHMYSLAPQATD